MKGVNNDIALLAVLLLLLTSLATVSGSMPTIESIETYFEEHSAPNRGKATKLRMPLEEGFAGLGLGGTESSETSLSAAYGVDKEDIKELTEGFKAHGKKEHFGNCGTHKKEPFKQHKKEHFGAHGKKHEHFGAHGKKQVIEPFQGSMYSKF
jgi:hypothetical protein